jgi:tetratricopeptide (TPR) repeat protein
MKYLWWLNLATILWLLITLLPLPAVNAKRETRFQRAEHLLTKLRQEQSEPTLGAATAKDLPAAVPRRLSLNAIGTAHFTLALAGAGSLFWLMAGFDFARRRRFLKAVVILGTLVAALGLIGRLLVPQGNLIWWLIPVEYPVGGGPFINRNHFATFCAMLTPFALCLAVTPSLLSQRRGKAIAAPQKRFLLRLFYLICLLVLVSGTVLSLSRGGMLSMLLGLSVTASFWLRERPALATGGTALALLVVLAFLFWPSEAVQQRIETLNDLESASPGRTQMWREAWAQWRDYPLCGGGAESFRALNAQYRLEPGVLAPLYAHNEYAQLFADHGLMGVGLVLALLLGYAACLRQSRRDARPDERLSTEGEPHLQPQRLSRPLLAGTCGVLVVLACHFTCEFPCRLPLNAFLAAALLAMGMPLTRAAEESRPKGRNFLIFSASRLALVAVVCWLTWQYPAATLRLGRPLGYPSATLPELGMVVTAIPTYWVPWFELGRRCCQSAQAAAAEPAKHPGVLPRELYQTGQSCILQAVEYNPRDYRMAKVGTEIALDGGDMITARHFFATSVALEPEQLKLWRDWLLAELDLGNDATAKSVILLAEKQSKSKNVAALWQTFATALEKRGDLDEAVTAMKQALKLAPQNVNWWWSLAKLEQECDNPVQERVALRQAAELDSKKYYIWWRLGQVELELGNDAAANRSFSHAVRLRPSLRKSADKLWKDARRGR